MAKRSDYKLDALPETIEAGALRGELDSLLREAHSLKGFEKRMKEVKARIGEIIQAEGLSGDGVLGVRSGNLCAITSWRDGRESFNRELAVEAGVTPEQIKQSMKRGEGYWMVELQAIGEEVPGGRD